MAKSKDPQDNFWRENWSVVFFMVTVAVALIGTITFAAVKFLHP